MEYPHSADTKSLFPEAAGKIYDMDFTSIRNQTAMNYSIRPANKQDTDSLWKLEQKAFNPDIYHLMSQRSYNRLLSDGRADILVAVDENDRILGSVVLLYRKNSSIGRLYSISVDPVFQGGAIGKCLWVAAEDMVRKRGKKALVLEIRDDDKRLGRYEAIGYKKTGEVKSYYPDGAACYKLRKDLQ